MRGSGLVSCEDTTGKVFSMNMWRVNTISMYIVIVRQYLREDVVCLLLTAGVAVGWRYRDVTARIIEGRMYQLECQRGAVPRGSMSNIGVVWLKENGGACNSHYLPSGVSCGSNWRSMAEGMA
jgi:hypothetical protein